MKLTGVRHSHVWSQQLQVPSRFNTGAASGKPAAASTSRRSCAMALARWEPQRTATGLYPLRAATAAFCHVTTGHRRVRAWGDHMLDISAGKACACAFVATSFCASRRSTPVSRARWLFWQILPAGSHCFLPTALLALHPDERFNMPVAHCKPSGRVRQALAGKAHRAPPHRCGISALHRLR